MTQQPTAYGFTERLELEKQRLNDIENAAIYARIRQLEEQIHYLGWFAVCNCTIVIIWMIVVLWRL